MTDNTAERQLRTKRWAKCGAITGWAIAMFLIKSWTPRDLGPTPTGPAGLGSHDGLSPELLALVAALMIAVLIGGGALIGAGLARWKGGPHSQRRPPAVTGRG